MTIERWRQGWRLIWAFINTKNYSRLIDDSANWRTSIANDGNDATTTRHIFQTKWKNNILFEDNVVWELIDQVYIRHIITLRQKTYQFQTSEKFSLFKMLFGTFCKRKVNFQDFLWRCRKKINFSFTKCTEKAFFGSLKLVEFLVIPLLMRLQT